MGCSVQRGSKRRVTGKRELRCEAAGEQRQWQQQRGKMWDPSEEGVGSRKHLGVSFVLHVLHSR